MERIYRHLRKTRHLRKDERPRGKTRQRSFLATHAEPNGPEKYLEFIHGSFIERYGEPKRGRDVLIITGVGKIYPFMRAHIILESIQPVFSDIPVVLFYPGTYDGQQLKLFGTIADGNYYRAFNQL